MPSFKTYFEESLCAFTDSDTYKRKRSCDWIYVSVSSHSGHELPDSYPTFFHGDSTEPSLSRNVSNPKKNLH